MEHYGWKCLKKRNELTQIYDESQTKQAVTTIRTKYFAALKQVYETLHSYP